jgi:hypothetical protein
MECCCSDFEFPAELKYDYALFREVYAYKYYDM